MRTIEYANASEKDSKRVEAAPRHAKDAQDVLNALLELLVHEKPLSTANRDHALAGDWAGYRECHVKPDLLLNYKKPADTTLRLARLGSHSELFG